MIRPSRAWARVPRSFLPFADAASAELPLGRLLRLSLFQVSVGMALALLNGTLNRIMIVEMNMSAALVSTLIALPLLFAPARALIGHRSDNHRSALGWRRVPYIWLGTLMQFGGLAIMPFALLVASGDTHGPVIIGEAAAALAFLMVGVGVHTTQTAGLALATDLAPEHTRPRVVALLYVMLLVGMAVGALVLGWLLTPFGKVKLIQVIQGAAAVTFVLNVIALWQQEARRPGRTEPRIPFREAWAQFRSSGRTTRLLVATGCGAAGFGMQDALLEPYGAQVLGLSVGATTQLTALIALGTLAGFAFAAQRLARGADAHGLAAIGALIGCFAFAAIIFASPLNSPELFRTGTVLIGLGGGLFAVGTLTAAMALGERGGVGLALGAWGAVQATATGLAIATGGVLRDVLGAAGASGALGPALTSPAAAYGIVYHIEIALLFATLAAIGPLVRAAPRPAEPKRFGLAEFPG